MHDLVEEAPALKYLQQEDLLSPGTSACIGCSVELALRFTLRVLGKDVLLFTAPGCALTFTLGLGTHAQVKLAQFPALLTNVASLMTGARRYYEHVGRSVKVVAFVGDGATVDIGFQALSGAAERQENLVYICYDNEGYMTCGAQRSGSTSMMARTTTSPVGKMRHGKEQNAKYMPLLMLFHDVPYVATATIAYPRDYARKLIKAMNVTKGLSYIHLFTPCITGWGIAADRGLDVSSMAVETNYFPLWEAEQGKVRLTQEITDPKPIHEYTDLSRKYAHLTTQDLEQVQEQVNARYATIRTLAQKG